LVKTAPSLKQKLFSAPHGQFLSPIGGDILMGLTQSMCANCVSLLFD
jgi:hypothetical protein